MYIFSVQFFFLFSVFGFFAVLWHLCKRLLIIVVLQSHWKLKAITQSLEWFSEPSEVKKRKENETCVEKWLFFALRKEEKMNDLMPSPVKFIVIQIFMCKVYVHAMPCHIMLCRVTGWISLFVAVDEKGHTFPPVNRVDVLLLHKRI